MLAAATIPLDATSADGLLAPAVLFALAVIGGLGMILLLPSRRATPVRTLGGILLLGAGLVLMALLAKSEAGVGAYFWIFSAIAIISAVRVITHPKPVYSALYFVLTVMASAGLFVLMWAQFMAAALVLIYAGAILVTYVFVIMLAAEATPAGRVTMHEQLAEHDTVSREPIVASAVGFALLGILLFVICDRMDISRPQANPAGQVTAVSATASQEADSASILGFSPEGATQTLGAYLFTKQLVNLELAGLILTVAMVGAIVIAKKRVVGADEQVEIGPEDVDVVLGPATPINDNPHSIPVYGTENPRQKEYPQT